VRTPQLGYTPLLIAANAEHLGMVELLIAKGADVNTADQVRRGGEEILVMQGVFESCWGMYLGC